mgnify:CR=1 FL=1
MNTGDIAAHSSFTVLNPGGGRPVTSVYCCDLLSLVMGRAPAGSAWVTVMGNQNAVAVASLADTACIVLAEGITMDETGLQKAREHNVAVFATRLPVYEAAALGQLLAEGLNHGAG